MHSQMRYGPSSNFNTQQWIDDYNKMTMKDNSDWIESFQKINLDEKRYTPLKYERMYSTTSIDI